VQINIPAIQKSLEGTVKGFVPVADPKTKNVMVKIGVPYMPRVVENMSAIVLIPTSTPKQHTLVPRDALINSQGRDMIYTIKGGKAVPIPVTILAFTGEHVALNSAQIAPDMPVIVDGAQRLRPGQMVEVIGHQ